MKNEQLLVRRCGTSLVTCALLLEVFSTPGHACTQIEQEEEESAIDAKRRKRLGNTFSVPCGSTPRLITICSSRQSKFSTL